MTDHSEDTDHSGNSHSPSRGYGPGGYAVPGGLAVATDGLRFDPSETRFDPETEHDWTFRIVADDGTPVTEFGTAHGALSHLIVVRRDLTQFQHLHPELEPDGTWRVSHLSFPEPGAYRAFVDVVADGNPTTLGFDLFVPGSWDPDDRPGSKRTATAEGYEVTVRTDDVEVRQHGRLVFDVLSDGSPVSVLDEYLGARGHLVALREGDLAYLHVHPEDTAPDSGRVEFGAQFPTAGRYRLFLQTKPDGNLITTPFDLTLESTGSGVPGA